MESLSLLRFYNQDGCHSDKAQWRSVILWLLSSSASVVFILSCFEQEDYIVVAFSSCCQVSVPQRKTTGVI